MKIIIMLIAIISSASFCYGQTQEELSNKARAEYESSDTELNKVYQNVLQTYKGDPLLIKMTRGAQKAWLGYRDAQVKMKYPTYSNVDGTILPMCYYYYIKELTDHRVLELKQWLNGVDEGDVCSGSVKMRK